MSNEDKMREEFHNFELAFELDNDRRPTKFEKGWKACAAIKDAEIAELKIQVAGWKYNWNESTDREIQLQKEIASRDLLIKDLRDLRIDEYSLTAHADYYLEIQRITEHHDSRALEKLLLEAELKVLCDAYDCCKPYGVEFLHMMTERKDKLDELNKDK